MTTYIRDACTEHIRNLELLYSRAMFDGDHELAAHCVNEIFNIGATRSTIYPRET